MTDEQTVEFRGMCTNVNVVPAEAQALMKLETDVLRISNGNYRYGFQRLEPGQIERSVRETQQGMASGFVVKDGHIVEFSLGKNAISKTSDPAPISQFTQVEVLRIASTPSIPPWLGNFQLLRVLILDNSRIDHVPDNILALKNLECLYMRKCGLHDFPKGITSLIRLRVLDLSENRFDVVPQVLVNYTNNDVPRLLPDPDILTKDAPLPDSISHMRSLEELNLRNCGVTSLPDTIGDLTNLRVLQLDGNQVAWLSASIERLRNLEELYLKGNPITALPNWLGSLANLRVLDVSSCRLTALPLSISQLKKLEDLRVEGNSGLHSANYSHLEHWDSVPAGYNGKTAAPSLDQQDNQRLNEKKAAAIEKDLKIVGLTNVTSSGTFDLFFQSSTIIDCGTISVSISSFPVGISKKLFRAIKPTQQDEAIGETLENRIRDVTFAAESAVNDDMFDEKILQAVVVRAIDRDGTLEPHIEELLIKSIVIPPPQRYYGQYRRGILLKLPNE